MEPVYPTKRHEESIAVREGDRVILRRYDTSTCETIASVSAGPPFEEKSYLMRTPNGRYFVYHEYLSEANIVPLSLEDAVTRYLGMPQKNMKFEQAFKGVEVEDA